MKYQIPPHIEQMILNTVYLAQTKHKLPQDFIISVVAQQTLVNIVEKDLQKGKDKGEIYLNILHYIMGYYYGFVDGNIPEPHRKQISQFRPEDLK